MLSVAADHCVSCLNSCPFPSSLSHGFKLLRLRFFMVNIIKINCFPVFHISGLTKHSIILPEILSHNFTYIYTHINFV